MIYQSYLLNNSYLERVNFGRNYQASISSSPIINQRNNLYLDRNRLNRCQKYNRAHLVVTQKNLSKYGISSSVKKNRNLFLSRGNSPTVERKVRPHLEEDLSSLFSDSQENKSKAYECFYQQSKLVDNEAGRANNLEVTQVTLLNNKTKRIFFISKEEHASGKGTDKKQKKRIIIKNR